MGKICGFASVGGVGLQRVGETRTCVRRGRIRVAAEKEQEDDESHRFSLVQSRKEPESQDPESIGEAGPVEEKIGAEEIQMIKKAFSVDTFFPTNVFPCGSYVVFDGNFRKDQDEALSTIHQKLEKESPGAYLPCIEDLELTGLNNPVVVVYRSETASLSDKSIEVSYVLGAFALYIMASNIFSITSPMDDLQRLPGIYLILSVFLALGGSIVMQRLCARRRGLKLADSFFIPLPKPFNVPISFSTVDRVGGSRADRFWVSFWGPGAVLLISMVLMLVGLTLTSVGGPLWQLNVNTVTGHWFLSFFAKLFLGSSLPRSADQTIIGLHPLAVIASFSMKMAAVNLLPLEPFDGGRMVRAVFGRQFLKYAGMASMGILVTISGFNPGLLIFVLVKYFAPWPQDKPARNEMRKCPNWMGIVCYLLAWLVVMTLVPFPSSWDIFTGFDFPPITAASEFAANGMEYLKSLSASGVRILDNPSVMGVQTLASAEFRGFGRL